VLVNRKGSVERSPNETDTPRAYIRHFLPRLYHRLGVVRCLRLPRSITLDHLLFYIAPLLDARAYTSMIHLPMELEGSKIVRLELETEELQ